MADIVAIRSSSWAELFDCAYRWEGKYLLGLTQKTSLRAHLGTSLHASTAFHDTKKIAEVAPPEIEEGQEKFIEVFLDPEYDFSSENADISVNDAEQIGLSLHANYVDFTENDRWTGVEITPEPLDISTEHGVTIRMTGTLDRCRISVDSEGIGITDVKSGKRAVSPNGIASTKGHHIQVGCYEILAAMETGKLINQPAEIIGLQTIKMARVGRGVMSDPSLTMIGNEQTPGLIDIAARMLKSGAFPPNPTSVLCSPKYCPRWELCPYHD